MDPEGVKRRSECWSSAGWIYRCCCSFLGLFYPAAVCVRSFRTAAVRRIFYTAEQYEVSANHRAQRSQRAGSISINQHRASITHSSSAVGKYHGSMVTSITCIYTTLHTGSTTVRIDSLDSLVSETVKKCQVCG